MKLSEMKNLVICSTLNQITNYLVIKKLNPDKIFNITYDEDTQDNDNNNMKNSKWNKYLNDVLEYEGLTRLEDIPIKREQLYDIEKFKEIMDETIIKKIGNQPIVWHITGGQRFIALAVSKIVKERREEDIIDKVIYVEGNEEELIMLEGCESDEERTLEYFDNSLRIDKALKLSGFKIEDDILCNLSLERENRELKLKEGNEEDFKKENQFYASLYSWMTSKEGKETTLKLESEYTLNKNKKISQPQGCFRNLLIMSNTVKNKKRENDDEKKNNKDTERYKYLNELYIKLDKELTKYGRNIEYNLMESKELRMNYPAGYIFEKLVFHRIYNKLKDNKKVVQIISSLKIKLEKNTDKSKGMSEIVDELDIAILTNTGKIINIECKSGDMSGDNAKSTKYTTYSIANVFGMPILASPLYNKEDSNDILKYSFSAKRAAERANLNVLNFDELEKISDYI